MSVQPPNIQPMRSDDTPSVRPVRSVRKSAPGAEIYKHLVDTVRDYAIFALDSAGYVLSWNAGAERFKGYEASEIIGRHFSVFYPEEDIASGKPQLELEIAERDGRVEDEGWRVRKDGTRFWANVVITALRAPDGTLTGFAKVTRDLTERRAAHLQQLNDARRLAESQEANRTKSGFLAAMSHELRTPLNAIGGYAELLLAGIGGEISDQQRQYVERIRQGQKHLLGVINDILNFSRIESGQLKYDTRAHALQAIVGDVLPLIEPQATSRSIRLEQIAGAEPRVMADRAKVEQILLNLLSNAVKFTAPGGAIEVALASDAANAFVAVRDTGSGIQAEDLEAIFQPFVQVGRSLNSPNEGTGLGLAISSDLALGMGGALSVESVVGEGSTFTLRLPLATTTCEGKA
jgi:PAS domain S-box-containing protein